MSIREVSSYGKTRYQSRYRVAGNPNPKTRTFDRKRDAEAWEATVRLANRNQHPVSLGGTQTLQDFGIEYVAKYGRVELAPSTMRNQRDIWNKHILPGLGRYTLNYLVEHPDVIQEFKAKLVSDGVGLGAVSKALSVLSSVLGKAVEWNRIPRNPATAVRKPSGKRVRLVEAFSPVQIEAVRSHMPRERDRRLVSLMGYAGLRPGEALALTQGDIRDNTITISKSICDGVVGPTKTGRPRTVRLLKPLADDLKGCRPGLLFQRSDGGPWREHDYKNWRNRIWKPAIAAAGLGTLTVEGEGRSRRERYKGPRPYDLRHSFASLLLGAHKNPIAVAAQMGHGPKVLFDVYAHIIHEHDGQPDLDPEALILQARLQRTELTLSQPTTHVAA